MAIFWWHAAENSLSSLQRRSVNYW